MHPIPNSLMIGEARNRELLSAATSYVYQSTAEGELQAHFFFPPEYQPQSQNYPTIVFFHGGLWDIFAPAQFIPHCHHFASRGMIAVTIEYRNQAHLHGSPEDSITDAKAALAFLLHHGPSLGINPAQITLVGSSAGANAALCATLHPPDPQADPLPKPAALILFGPITDTTPKGIGHQLFSCPKVAKTLSPSSHLPQKGLPPCLIFHGENDRVVPIEHSQNFAKRYRRRRNKCDLLTFKNAGHTFFNYNSDQHNYSVTLQSADHFLTDLGLLDPNPLPDLY